MILVQTKKEKNTKRRIHRAKNSIRINKQKRENYTRRSNEINAKRRKKYEKTREQHNKWKREYRAKNRESVNQYQREYYQKNREKMRENDRIRRLEHIDERRKRSRVYHEKVAKQKHLEIKIKVFTHYSNGKPKCACCGENLIEFLALDHIKGREAMGDKRGDTGIKIYRRLEKNGFPSGYQILCHNCNIAKGKDGICPHKN